MINIYQLFPRLFGNNSRQTIPFGTISENGCGKFSDINEAAIHGLKDLGVTHIWLTGIIRHASLTDYSAYGIPQSHPAVVKGRAGSPYAISDYYDVDPDLAADPARRMEEFRQLVNRIHQNGMKVLIDFVPNHLARQYQSVAKPEGIVDFGSADDQSVFFKQNNNFYYIVGEVFTPPSHEDNPLLSIAETNYEEFPARVTGNDCFTAKPSLNDWYETIKLNYGIDYRNNLRQHFDPVPDTWQKQLQVLDFWANQGVDGFRADMSEMVPVEFWRWLIAALRKTHPRLLMIAEIYQPALYPAFISAGFDYLYDKVGLYNTLEKILIHGHPAESISEVWKKLNITPSCMLRFMENHDEKRLASSHFAGDFTAALPAVIVSALMHTGPFMIYNGQETGEKAVGAAGYSGDDGRTSIYDYTHLPSLQGWVNKGSFDGAGLNREEKNLRRLYQRLMKLRLEEEAIYSGEFYDLMWANPWHTDFDPQYVYAFLRYTHKHILLIVANFNRSESRSMRLNIPKDALRLLGITAKTTFDWQAINLLKTSELITFDVRQLSTEGIHLHLQASETAILKLHPKA